MDIPSADAHCRRHLEARRACLGEQIDALREQASALWNRAHARLLAGEDPTPLEHLACAAETRRRQASMALLAIEQELGEGAEA